MAKSRYDRNVDRGAAQQRDHGQGAKKEDHKPGSAEDAARSPRHSGGQKHTGGPAKGSQEQPWRPKSRGDNE